MKKRLSVLLVCLLMLATLAACGKDDPTTNGKQDPSNPSASMTDPTNPKPTDPKPTDPKPTEPKPTESKPTHTCKSTGQWEMNLTNHWRYCDTCGAKVNDKAHTAVNGSCTKCSAEIVVAFEGDAYLTVYDEWANPATQLHYLADGTLDYTQRFAYTYTDDGIMLTKKVFLDDVLFSDSTYDQYGNLLSLTLYNEDGTVQTATVYELLYDDAGNVTAEKSLVDSVLTYECTYAYPAGGESYIDSETFYNEDGTKEQCHYNEQLSVTKKTYYDAQGNVTDEYTYAYVYDKQGNVTQETCQKNGNLAYMKEFAYDASYAMFYLSEETIYTEDGAHYINQYNVEGKKLYSVGFDAQGNPINNSGKFDASVAAPLVGTWQGTVEMTGEELGYAGSNMSISATYTMIFDATGKLYTKIAFNEQEFVEFAIAYNIDYLYDMLREQVGEGFTKAEIDALFEASYGMSVREYVEAQITADAFADQITQEMNGVYYVEDGKLYQGEDWSAYMAGMEYHVEGSNLIVVDNGKEIVLEKQSQTPDVPDQPQDPMPDVEIPEQFDAAVCAPLFGVWEYTESMTGADMGIPALQDRSVEMTVRMTFTQEGVVVMQMITDLDAYYDFMLALAVEATYAQMEAMGMTREQADAQFAQMGTTIEEAAAANLPARDEMLPEDGYFGYYVDGDVLYYNENEQRFSVENDTLTLFDESGESVTLHKADA